MAARKYEKYILTDLKTPQQTQEADTAYHYADRATRILWLEDEIMKGAFSIILSWYWKATEKEGSPSHVHDFDEVVGFIGNDPQNPSDLGGEVEFWLEDEQYFLTKSCLIFCPAGLRHCPLRVTRVDRPLLFLAVSLTGKYKKDGVIWASS
jgi:hypothetical protein